MDIVAKCIENLINRIIQSGQQSPILLCGPATLTFSHFVQLLFLKIVENDRKYV